MKLSRALEAMPAIQEWGELTSSIENIERALRLIENGKPDGTMREIEIDLYLAGVPLLGSREPYDPDKYWLVAAELLKTALSYKKQLLRDNETELRETFEIEIDLGATQ